MLSEKEGKWRMNLPETYKEFVKKTALLVEILWEGVQVTMEMYYCDE